MLTALRQWLHSATPLQDPIHQQQLPMFQVILIALASIQLTLIPVSFVFGGWSLGISILALCAIMTIITVIILRRGHFNIAVSMTIAITLADTFLPIISTGYKSSFAGMFALAIPIIMSGLLGTRRTLWSTIAIVISFLSLLSILTFKMPETLMPANRETLVISEPIVIGLLLVFIGICFDSFGQVLRQMVIVALERQLELEQVRAQQEQIIDQRTQELRSSLHTVEQREQDLARTLADLQDSKAMLSAVSAPTIPVMPGVLLVPIIGHLDSQRADSLTTNTLTAIEGQHSHAVIFDITGVEVVDTHVAQVLLRTASAATLLGAHVMMVGIRPEVAQTMVALGIDLGMFMTYSDLRSALTEILRQDGWVRMPIVPI